ncbi:MAG: hypothetical protein HY824_01555 [Acidobacteria bacterium]|nr:hypothetical protein [Acidobacteriota bacterium]
MRSIALTTAALVLAVTGTSLAQGFIQFNSQKDFFGVSFPGEPGVRDTTWTSEGGISLPARVYSVENARGRYSMTVVDYKDVEKLSAEQAAQCQKNGGEGDACMNGWRGDVGGAIVWATWQFMQRDAKVTFYGWYSADQVPGHQLQLQNPDGSRTFATVNMHGTRLYVLEATVPKGAPAPGLFQQSLMFLDEQGRSIRYRVYYSPNHSDEWKFPAPPPPRAR